MGQQSKRAPDPPLGTPLPRNHWRSDTFGRLGARLDALLIRFGIVAEEVIEELPAEEARAKVLAYYSARERHPSLLRNLDLYLLPQ